MESPCSHSLDYQCVQDSYPVHKAAREGRADILAHLIRRGSDVNQGTFDLVKPLHEACLNGRFNCIQMLLAAGAEVNSRNIDGSTPLCDACSRGDTDGVQLLLSHGATVNPPLLMTSPLHEAVLKDKWRCVELLISAEADIEASDCHFGSPLHVAAYLGHLKCADILLCEGACVNVSKIHHTPLHDAALHQDCDFLSLLLNHGAHVYATNNRGFSAADFIPGTVPAKQLIQLWESTPRSLTHFCRLRIRRVLGRKRLKRIQELPLPRFMKSYVSFAS